METWIPVFASLTDSELDNLSRTSSDFAGAAAYILQLRREIGDLVRNQAGNIAVPFADDLNRCAVCGYGIAQVAEDGCVAGNCSQRPLPAIFYSPERVERERARR